MLDSLFTLQPRVEIMVTHVMFERERLACSSLLTDTLSTLSIIGSHRTFSDVGGAYSTSLSSRAIGSALVDRLKLQSRVAPRGKRGRRRPNQD